MQFFYESRLPTLQVGSSLSKCFSLDLTHDSATVFEANVYHQQAVLRTV